MVQSLPFKLVLVKNLFFRMKIKHHDLHTFHYFLPCYRYRLLSSYATDLYEELALQLSERFDCHTNKVIEERKEYHTVLKFAGLQPLGESDMCHLILGHGHILNLPY